MFKIYSKNFFFFKKEIQSDSPISSLLTFGLNKKLESGEI